MPKAFSAQEKERIKARILERGEKLFERQGIKKTTVDELAQAAGISKGAFYLFYESKEELLMEILERLEADFRSRIFDVSVRPGSNSRQLLTKLFKNALLTWDEYPLLENFNRSDFEYLARKLSPERLSAHADRDDTFVEDFLRRIKKEGITVKASPGVATSLMKSLFFVALHRDDLGQKAYTESMEVLTDLVARYLVEGK